MFENGKCVVKYSDDFAAIISEYNTFAYLRQLHDPLVEELLPRTIALLHQTDVGTSDWIIVESYEGKAIEDISNSKANKIENTVHETLKRVKHWTFSDPNWKNMLYNETTQKITIIDTENLVGKLNTFDVPLLPQDTEKEMEINVSYFRESVKDFYFQIVNGSNRTLTSVSICIFNSQIELLHQYGHLVKLDPLCSLDYIHIHLDETNDKLNDDNFVQQMTVKFDKSSSNNPGTYFFNFGKNDGNGENNRMKNNGTENNDTDQHNVLSLSIKQDMTLNKAPVKGNENKSGSGDVDFCTVGNENKSNDMRGAVGGNAKITNGFINVFNNNNGNNNNNNNNSNNNNNNNNDGNTNSMWRDTDIDSPQFSFGGGYAGGIGLQSRPNPMAMQKSFDNVCKVK